MNLLKDLLNAAQVNEEMHFSKKGNGSFGDILIIDDNNPIIKKIAAALGVHDGWNLKKISSDLYAAYNSGDRLTFFSHPDDFEADED